MEIHEVRVGDVIRRPYSGNTRTRTVESLDSPNGRIICSLPVEGNSQVTSISRNDLRLYSLVSRPGDTPGEEVKQMTNKFNIGDTIQYDTVRRLVLDSNAASQDYILSGDLRGNYPTDRDTYSFLYIDENYELLFAAPVQSIGATDAHKADMATLSTKLAAEARRRGWCTEYEGVINGWNADLTIPLDPYPTTQVKTTATIIVTLERTDEADSGQQPGDLAYDLYWGNALADIEAPGWTTVNVVRDVHTYDSV